MNDRHDMERGNVLAMGLLRSSGVAVGLMLGATGCVAEPDAPLDAGDLAQPLLSDNGWRPWTRVADVSDPDVVDSFTGDPAVCLATRSATVVIGRDSATNTFVDAVWWRAWAGAVEGFDSVRWQSISNRTFNSNPACTALDDPSLTSAQNHQIAIAGRNSSSNASNNNRYYVKTMLVDTLLDGPDPNAALPDHPTTVVNWTKISTEAYASAPAMTVASGALLLVGRKSDNRLYLLRNDIDESNTTSPYDSGNWDPEIQLPALPSPWVAAGNPAIANTSPFNGWDMIMTRATSGSTNRIYYVLWNGAWATAWIELPTGSTVVRSDPAIAVDIGPPTTSTLNLPTVFFRGVSGNGTNSNRIFNLSGLGFTPDWGPVRRVSDEDPDSFSSSANPAGVGSGTFEGRHMIVARKSDNQFYYATPTPGTVIP